MNHATPHSPQQIAGLTYCIQPDGIHVFRFSDARRESIDAWVELARANDQHYAASRRHLRTLFDIGDQWFTSYSLGTVMRIAYLTPPDLRASSAVVAGQSAMMALIHSMIAPVPQNYTQQIAIFMTEDDALHWLNHRLQELGT